MAINTIYPIRKMEIRTKAKEAEDKSNTLLAL